MQLSFFPFFFVKRLKRFEIFFGMFVWSKSSLRPLVVCDFVHSLCTVKFEKEEAPLLTNYLYVWTFALCLFQYKNERKEGRRKEQERCF